MEPDFAKNDVAVLSTTETRQDLATVVLEPVDGDASAVAAPVDGHGSISSLMALGWQPSSAKQTPCKCCGAMAAIYGVVDFHKNCEEQRRKVLGPSGVPVYYYQCPVCRFLFTTAFDHFTKEDFHRHVYNDDYLDVDTDYRESRPRGNADFLAQLLAGAKPGRILDYGCGNGVLAESLRAAGFAQVDTYDPFVPRFSDRPTQSYDLIVSFEVAEHSVDPGRLFADMNDLLAAPGLILFSTLLQPANLDQQGLNWWYVAPRNGHVSLYSMASLQKVVGPLGFRLVSFNGNMHVLFRELPDFAKRFSGEWRLDRYQTTMEQDSAKGSSAVLSTTEASQDLATVLPGPADADVSADTAAADKPLEGNAEELHKRGLRLINEGKAEEALPFLRQAVELNPTSPDYHHNLGVALAHRNRLDEAIATFREALRLKPEGTSALSNMGLALSQQGKIDEAAAAFAECLRLEPNSVEVRHRLANVLRNADKPAEAIPHLQEAIRLRPESAELHHSLGLALADTDKSDEAIAAYREALRIEPKYADALNNLGIVLQNTGKSEEAVACYRKALKIRPHSSETYNNLGVALAALDLHEDAIMAYRSALQLFPKSAAAYSNLGNAFRQIGLVDDAIAALEQALQLNPNYAEGHNNKAVALVQGGDPAAGVAAYNRALELKPDYPDAHLNRALARLLIGDYDEGLEDYEWRWRRQGRAMPNWGRPAWDGDDPVGRTLLLWGEQGLGDTLQYCRYAALLVKRGATPILCVPELLVRLLRTMPGVAKVESSSDRLPPFSAHAPLMGMPRLFKMRSLDEAPAPVPYLSADREAAAACRERVRAGADLVVGVVWRGNPKYAGDKIRSVAPELFAPLAKIPGVRVVSLMKETTDEERETVGAEDIGATAWVDFAEAAAVFVNVDLVISVDTAAAHLAGALGLPVWIALPSAPDMRWGLKRDDSPWYPSARLFRQERRADFAPVFARIVDELNLLVRRGLRPVESVGKSALAESLQTRGMDLMRENRREEAATYLADAVRLKPDSPAMRLNLGVALAQLRKLDDAVREFRKSVELDPDSALGHANLGLAYIQANRHAEAIDVLETAARLDGGSTDVFNHLGISLAQVGRDDEAARAYARAIELRPGYHAPHTNLGNLLRSQGKLEEALTCYAEALLLCPSEPDIYNNRAIAYDGMQQTERALADYDKALAIDPAHAETRFNRALALLLRDDYAQGLEEYEWRWRRPGRGMPDWGVPLWDGCITPGKKLLIWAEQGLGDMIHCCRFASLLAERGLEVFLQTRTPLARLLRSLRGVAGVIGTGEAVPTVDAHVPVMSLPRLWGMKRLDDAPGPVPYLADDDALSAACRDRVRNGAALVVGVCWSGNPQYAGDRTRSAPAEVFARLAEVPGVRLVSLMKEAPAAELATAGAADIGAWPDLAEMAAALTNLDLVISVDTAAVHLAGALGVPVWIALPLAPDWRWGLTRADSPWYPTARLFRQESRGLWQPVFLRIAEELAQFKPASERREPAGGLMKMTENSFIPD